MPQDKSNQPITSMSDKPCEPSVDFHARLQESSLKIPVESMKRNIKGLQKIDEKVFKKTDDLVKEMAKCKTKEAQRQKLKQIVASLKTHEKKVKSKIEVEKNLQTRIRKRLDKLEELKRLKDSGAAIHDLNDTRLLKWYRDQTNLLVADYLLKNDHNVDSNSGLLLLKSFHFEDMIDSDIILLSNKISSHILNKDLGVLIQWINDNKSYLKKIKSRLEFETRFQEYVELVKSSDFSGAIRLFNDYLIQFTRTYFRDIQLATGLLIFAKKAQCNVGNVNFQRYNALLSADRYTYLSDLFLSIYYKMHGIPEEDPLLVYLSVGVSSLKTRSCLTSHETDVMSFDHILAEKLSTDDHFEQSSCPICSLEFRQLNSLLPYSHVVQSHLFETPVMLPNGNIYDKAKLLAFSKGSNPQGDEIVDPIKLESFTTADMITMFPT